MRVLVVGATGFIGSAIAASEGGAPLPVGYHPAFKLWFVLGWPAFLGLAVVFALMVMKPDIW